MLTAYEQHLLASYLVNAASSLHHRDPEASELAEWVADKANRIARGRNRRRFRRQWADEDRDEGMSASKLRALRETLRVALVATGKPRGDRATLRLRRLGRSLGLTRSDLAILELLLRYQTHPVIESMVDEVFGGRGRRAHALNLGGPAIPMLLGVTAGTVHRRMRSRCAPRPLGPGVHRRGRRPDSGRSTEPPHHHARRHGRRSAPPAARRRARRARSSGRTSTTWRGAATTSPGSSRVRCG